MRSICLLVFLAVTPVLMAQSLVSQTFAYSRDTTPGIPSRDNTPSSRRPPVKTDYFIYVVVKKGTPISSTGACVSGKFFAVTLRKVDSPVLVEHDVSVPTGVKDTLVGPTSDDVYQVELGHQQNSECRAQDERLLSQAHEVVVSLKSGQSTLHAVADKIVALRPAPGM